MCVCVRSLHFYCVCTFVFSELTVGTDDYRPGGQRPREQKCLSLFTCCTSHRLSVTIPAKLHHTHYSCLHGARDAGDKQVKEKQQRCQNVNMSSYLPIQATQAPTATLTRTHVHIHSETYCIDIQSFHLANHYGLN